ncbi:DUF4831 family protein [uncultured Psychroserpens sp.]|uniref:DUF4831 family protein n=1 Tax=uncultured Psychroserpens sp. TaxID=255436 RepID=UPI002622DF88|nr:DUF4831 family protein [uncultured Psychroserpens sp.]
MTLDKLNKNYDIYGYYSLPKTKLKIRIPIVKNSFEPSPILKAISDKDQRASDSICIEKFLKINFGWQYVKKPEAKFTLGKKVVLSSIHLPDPNKKYALAYKNSKAISQTLNLSISKDGLIQSGEFAQESKVYEISKKSIEIVSSIIGSASGLGTKDLSNDNDYSCITNERVKILIDKAIELQKAKYVLLQQYPNAVNNVDIVKFNFEQLDSQLKAIKNELLGKVAKKTHHITIYIDPQNDFTSKDLFKLSPSSGVITPRNSLFSNLSSDVSKNSGSNEKILKLVVQGKIVPDASSVLSTEATLTESSINSDAFLYYNIPAKYTLQLQYDNKPLSSFKSEKDKEGNDDYTIFFPQLGQVAYLPKDFKEANIVYYEDTGGIKSAKLSKEATVDANKIEGYYTALDSIRKTLKAIKKNNKPVEDEVEEVEEQVIRLIIDKNDTLQPEN